MKCPCCGKLWYGPAGLDCFFCAFWGASLAAGASFESMDRIIRKENAHAEIIFQPTGKGGFYAEISPSNDQRNRSGKENISLSPNQDPSFDERSFGLGGKI